MPLLRLLQNCYYYFCHRYRYFHTTLLLNTFLQILSLSGVVELTTQLLILKNILWLPFCQINKFGLNTLPSKTVAIPYTCGLSGWHRQKLLRAPRGHPLRPHLSLLPGGEWFSLRQFGSTMSSRLQSCGPFPWRLRHREGCQHLGSSRRRRVTSSSRGLLLLLCLIHLLRR